MTTPSDAKKKAATGANPRMRRAIYRERAAVILRIGLDLNEQLIRCCDSMQVPMNTYVNTLIVDALSQPDPLSLSRRDAMERGAEKLRSSIRMEPTQRARLNKFCEAANVSVNVFVCGLIKQDLIERGF